MKTYTLLAVLGSFMSVGYAQTTPIRQWHHLDPATDKTIGISTERAYELLKTLHTPVRPVIVAVIDGGVDTNHEDLKSMLWTNAKEIDGNGKDDDHNGYVDDIHGWNFIGLKDGHTIADEQKEETRLYARLKPVYEGKTRASLTPVQQTEFDLYQQVKPYFEQKRTEAEKDYQKDSQLLKEDQDHVAQLKKAFGTSKVDTAMLHYPAFTDTTLLQYARDYYQNLKRNDKADLDSVLIFYTSFNKRLKDRLDREYNLDFNPRPGIGDHPENLTERHYGNADAIGDYTERGTRHGTHVSGIIAAYRINSLGIRGIADHVQIMSVVAIPNGDERDKDVANAIRYAVDNGASVINMSFGKYFSPEKTIVDEAIRYANTKGVLLLHAAGNDHLDLDSARQYPSSTYLNGQTILNMITVGASSRQNDSTLVAPFSNYGQQMVDVFAPGVLIQSTTPKGTYGPSSGTSMAAPVVAGIAAVLKSYFPELSPADIKRIILKSAVPYHTQVVKPGTKQKVDFASLSKTGAIVNLYEAVKLAMAEQAITTRK
ncbi:S8 family peptidase [Spirosoma migulaei]